MMDDNLKAHYNAATLDYAKSIPSSAPMDRFGGGILNLTNPDPEIYKLELTLRNQRMDNQGNVIQIGPPLMNDEGVNRVVGFVQSIVNTNTIMSNYDRDLIFKMIKFASFSLIEDLGIAHHKYGVTGDVDSVRNHCITAAICLCMASSMRAMDQGEKKWLGTSMHEVRNTLVGDKKSAGLSGTIAKAFGMGG